MAFAEPRLLSLAQRIWALVETVKESRESVAVIFWTRTWFLFTNAAWDAEMTLNIDFTGSAP